MQIRKNFLTLALLGLASAGIGGCAPNSANYTEQEAGELLREYATKAGNPEILEQTESRELVYNLSNPDTYQYTYGQRNAGIWRAREFAKKARETEPELAEVLERHLNEIANSGI